MALGTFNRGSWLAQAGYDVRVTERCRAEDLGQPMQGPLEEIARHEIVRALCNKHDTTPATADTVGPEAGGLTLGTLRYGHDHRGAIWLDQPNNALWLCAYRHHRSGAPDDSFAFFSELIAEERMYPTDADRIWLFNDRAERLVEAIPEDARLLVEAAAAAPGNEVIGVIGGIRVRAVIVEVLGIRELHAGISMRSGDPTFLVAILAALRPSITEFGDWRPESALPTGDLDGTYREVGYSCLLD